jgi:hypothetical protein
VYESSPNGYGINCAVLPDMGGAANMNQSLNLTPERGPSVWDEAPRRVNPLNAAFIAGGSMLAAYAFSSNSRNRTWLTGLGLGTLAFGLFSASGASFGAERMSSALNRIRPQRVPELDQVDLASKHSFPASDAPAVY